MKQSCSFPVQRSSLCCDTSTSHDLLRLPHQLNISSNAVSTHLNFKAHSWSLYFYIQFKLPTHNNHCSTSRKQRFSARSLKNLHCTTNRKRAWSKIVLLLFNVLSFLHIYIQLMFRTHWECDNNHCSTPQEPRVITRSYRKLHSQQTTSKTFME